MSCFLFLINLVRVSNKSKSDEKINGEYYTVRIMDIKPLLIQFWPEQRPIVCTAHLGSVVGLAFLSVTSCNLFSIDSTRHWLSSILSKHSLVTSLFFTSGAIQLSFSEGLLPFRAQLLPFRAPQPFSWCQWESVFFLLPWFIILWLSNFCAINLNATQTESFHLGLQNTASTSLRTAQTHRKKTPGCWDF
jgi:hypothetical protein